MQLERFRIRRSQAECASRCDYNDANQRTFMDPLRAAFSGKRAIALSSGVYIVAVRMNRSLHFLGGI